MTERFCAYCRTMRSGSFRRVLSLKGDSVRYMCMDCQDMRKKPREALNQLAQREAAERRARDAITAIEARKALEERKKHET